MLHVFSVCTNAVFAAIAFLRKENNKKSSLKKKKLFLLIDTLHRRFERYRIFTTIQTIRRKNITSRLRGKSINKKNEDFMKRSKLFTRLFTYFTSMRTSVLLHDIILWCRL